MIDDKTLWLKRAVTEVVMPYEESRNVTMMPLMGYFQITSEIYRLGNNLICQASTVVVISHLKQFIGCSLTIIHEGHACFMNNQSNSNISRMDNCTGTIEGVLGCLGSEMGWNKYHKDNLQSSFVVLLRCVCLLQLTEQRDNVFEWADFLKANITSRCFWHFFTQSHPVKAFSMQILGKMGVPIHKWMNSY